MVKPWLMAVVSNWCHEQCVKAGAMFTCSVEAAYMITRLPVRISGVVAFVPEKNIKLAKEIYVSQKSKHVLRSSKSCLKVKHSMSQGQVFHVSRSSKSCLKVKSSRPQILIANVIF